MRLVVRAAPRLALVVGAAFPGCQGSAPARGASRPTVEGGQAAAFQDLEAAKAAFRRSDGPMTALLDDAAWIRLEPDPSGVATRHESYLQGLTTFEVTLSTKDFVRPTGETYVLADSTGASVVASP